MDQETVINKALRDMKIFGFVAEEESEKARMILNAVYVAAWEEKGRLHGDRRSREVIQMTAGGKEMQSFHNTIHAAKALKCSRVPIRRSLLTGEPTSRGHIWKYKEDESTRRM